MRDLPRPGIEPVSPASAGEFCTRLSHQGSPIENFLIRIRNYSEASIHFKRKKDEKKGIMKKRATDLAEGRLAIIIHHSSPSISRT